MIGGIPGAGASMECGNLLGGVAARQLFTQQALKEAVKAIPLTLVVQRNGKDAVTFQPFQALLARLQARKVFGYGVAQRAVELVEDSRLHQERLHRGGKSRQHLEREVLHDKAMVERLCHETPIAVIFGVKGKRRKA